ncbi:hypothetical protein BD779DRAFT_1675510 [Infundibulicybe gibba]|nr:hypothetical protein BD779DRAFT_1675510 [Infundibulicybe gibba]
MSSGGKLNINSIKKLDGTNYRDWEEKVRTFLQFSSLWQITAADGREIEPTSTMDGTDIVPPSEDALTKFFNKDDQALGAILLTLSPDIAAAHTMYTTARARHRTVNEPVFQSYTPNSTIRTTPGANRNAIDTLSPYIEPQNPSGARVNEGGRMTAVHIQLVTVSGGPYTVPSTKSPGARITAAVNPLNTKYGVADPSQVFLDFRSALAVKISGDSNPEPEIMAMSTYFSHLTGNSVVLPPFVQAMILLSAIPSKWDNVGSQLLQTHSQSALTFEIVRIALVKEYQRCTAIKGPVQANKISGVKRKGKNPNWKEQAKDKAPESKPTEASSLKDKPKDDKARSSKGGNRAERRKKCQAKQADEAASSDGSAPDSTSQYGNSHLVSSAFIEEVIEEPRFVRKSKPLGPKERSLLVRLHDKPAQVFMGATPGILPGTYPTFEKALTLSQRIGAPVTTETLKSLEVQQMAQPEHRILRQFPPEDIQILQPRPTRPLPTPPRRAPTPRAPTPEPVASPPRSNTLDGIKDILMQEDEYDDWLESYCGPEDEGTAYINYDVEAWSPPPKKQRLTPVSEEDDRKDPVLMGEEPEFDPESWGTRFDGQSALFD